MARRSLAQRNIRSLTKTSGGKSYSVIIPVEFIKKLGWRSKQKLVVSLTINIITKITWAISE